MNKALIASVILLGVLVAISAGWFSLSIFLRAGQPEREPVLYKPTRESINYEVFKPALFLFEDIYFGLGGLIDWFRPANLRATLCDVAPSRPEGIPFELLRKPFDRCYSDAGAEDLSSGDPGD